MPEAHVEVLLIGGGVAAVRCARRLRRSGFGGSILIVGEEPHAPYNRPPPGAEGSGIRFGRCLTAPGAEPRRPPVPGAEHALLLRTLDDAVRLRTLARPGVRAVVIGGGFIGIEAASSLAARGASVTILELAPLAWAGSLGAELSAWAAEMLAAEGVTLRTGVAALRVEADAVWIADERLPADLILAGVGVRPREDLARDAGLGCQ